MEFDQVALISWTNLCTEERVMRENGASNNELKAIRIQIIMGMVELLPALSPIEKSSLLVTLIAGEFAAADTSLPSTLSDEDRMVLSALLSLRNGNEQVQEYTETSDPNPNVNDDASTVNDEVCED
jgi:hypothetical protein